MAYPYTEWGKSYHPQVAFKQWPQILGGYILTELFLPKFSLLITRLITGLITL